jgi:geranylgeranyl diphosphate synthase type II
LQIRELIQSSHKDKVQEMLIIFKRNKIDEWAMELKEEYIGAAYQHLDDIAVLSVRKTPLIEMAQFLVRRDY